MRAIEHFDIVIVGGGPSGIGAALAAARSGARCALIERHESLGGMGTSALVNNFCNAHYDGERYIIDGVFGHLRRRLLAQGALYATHSLEPFDHHAFCAVADEECARAGVQVFCAEVIKEVEVAGGRLVALCSAARRFVAKVFVDASGDALIAARAGVPFLERAAESPRPMPLTYCYVMGPVDLAKVKACLPDAILTDLAGQEYLYFGGQPALTEQVRKAREAGDLTIPRERIAVAYSIPGSPEKVSVNFGRVVVDDPTDPEQLRLAQEEGRQQVEEGIRFFRNYVPGCEGVELIELARQIGVRESRQIAGLYCLTREDVLSGRQFDDVIAQCRYSIDIHDPESDRTVMIRLPDFAHYDIPLRCLLPAAGPENLLVAGRAISATQEAMSSFRVSPSVMAIGEAAGTCAALALARGGRVGEVPTSEVQAVLLENDAILS